MKKAILQVKNVTKIYNDNSVKAVNDVSLDISEGEIVAIIGPSGSGKSTLLRCINRLVETTEGSIIFDDIEVVKADAKTLKNIRQNIGMIFQHYNLVYRLNVLEKIGRAHV